MNTILNKLKNSELILFDGALGTEISRRGYKTDLPLWSAQALIDHPEVIKDIHSQYIKAGAAIIRTNTFRTNSRTLKPFGLNPYKLTQLAVNLAKQAITENNMTKKVMIAGSIAPLEDCYKPDMVPSTKELTAEHMENVSNLYRAGVDFFAIETMNCIKEATITLKAARSTGKHAWVSFTCDKNGKLLSGESITKAICEIEIYNPFAILINCMPINTMSSAIKMLKAATDIPIGIYGNGIGSPNRAGDSWVYSQNSRAPEDYLLFVDKYIDKGILLVGGCCGTTPEYIRALYLHYNSALKL